MKRIKQALLPLVLLLCLCACAHKAAELPKLPDETGIAPYDLSEEESYLLQALGLENSAKVFAFRAPEETVSIQLKVYQLDEELDWVQTDAGDISNGPGSASGPLNGTFALRLSPDCSMNLYFNCLGRIAYQTDPSSSAQRFTSSARVFLTDFQEIKLGEEIPVALLAYDFGSSIEALTVGDYFAPASLGGIDLVQAVTLTFSDTALT